MYECIYCTASKSILTVLQVSSNSFATAAGLQRKWISRFNGMKAHLLQYQIIAMWHRYNVVPTNVNVIKSQLKG